jgi:hypothetical protein
MHDRIARRKIPERIEILDRVAAHPPVSAKSLMVLLPESRTSCLDAGDEPLRSCTDDILHKPIGVGYRTH